MSKKMRKAALDAFSYCSYEDAKARFKYQTLIQEYEELENEVAARRNKLDIVKQRKLILLAEVRFLQRRYKYLLKNKAAISLHEQDLEQRQKVGGKQKYSTKNQNQIIAKGTPSLPPKYVPPKKKGRVHAEKESVPRKAAKLPTGKHNKASQSAKVAAQQNPGSILDLNGRINMQEGNDAAFHNSNATIDSDHNSRIYGGNNAGVLVNLNRKEKIQAGKEAAMRSRAPIFDLNEVSREDDEFQNGYEVPRFVELSKGFIRDGFNEQPHNDLKLPICRNNVGDGSNAAGKRKISWQDPVSLRV